MSPHTGTSAMCTHVSNVALICKGVHDPIQNSGFVCFRAECLHCQRPARLEMFDVLGGFNPSSFAKPCFTGGKCLMKEWQVVSDVHMFYKFDLQHDCTYVSEFWAVCRAMPVLLGGG